MRRLGLLVIFIFGVSALFASTCDFRGSLEWSYDTNAFSDPLPEGYSLDSGYPNGGEFLKRQNIGLHLSSDIYFVDESRIGLSSFLSFRFPYSSLSIIPEGEGYDWEYREENSLSRQHVSLFCGLGPVFRFSAGPVDILLPIRLSLGSYDWFTSGIVVGVSIEPGINISVTDTVFLSFAFTYDAHLMKFFFSTREVYDQGYIMLTAGAYAGVGFRFGGGDA